MLGRGRRVQGTEGTVVTRPDQCTSAAPDGAQSCSLEAGAGGGRARIATAEVTLGLGSRGYSVLRPGAQDTMLKRERFKS